LPDTQFYTAEPQGLNGGSNAIFKRQIKWIVNNRTRINIVYVGQLVIALNMEMNTKWSGKEVTLQ